MRFFTDEFLNTLLGGLLVILGTRLQISHQNKGSRKEANTNLSILMDKGFSIAEELHQTSQEVVNLENSLKEKSKRATYKDITKQDLLVVKASLSKIRKQLSDFEEELNLALAKTEHLQPLYIRKMVLKVAIEIYEFNGTKKAYESYDLQRARFIVICRCSYWSQVLGWIAYLLSKKMKLA